MKFTDYDRTFLAHLARNGSAAVSHSGKESGRDFMRHPDSAWLTLTGQLGNGTANVPLRCATSSQESFHLAVKAFLNPICATRMGAVVLHVSGVFLSHPGFL